MISSFFGGMILFSVISGIFLGRLSQVSGAILGEGRQGILLCIELAGSLCIWSGFIKIAERSEMTHKLAGFFAPFLQKIFPGLDRNGEALQAISMNFMANLMGLGNAVTPLGIAAMQAMKKEEHCGKTASQNMIRFIVFNTASLQLFPASVGALRLAAGSKSPLEILPAVWIASAASVFSAYLAMICIENIYVHIFMYKKEITNKYTS